MGVETLAAILARLAVAILQWWAGREDLKRGELQRLLIEHLGLEQAALAWTVEALNDPHRAAALRVRDGALRLEGFQPSSDPPRAAAPGNLPDRR